MSDDFQRQRQAQLKAYRAQIEDTIRRFGWVVQSVLPGPGVSETQFSYTIGLHDKGLPELIVFGLPPPLAATLLNELARESDVYKSDDSLRTGPVRLEDWPLRFYLLPARKGLAGKFALGALSRSQGQARVTQVVWPDKNAKFPWDDEASDEYLLAQPILGTPPTPVP